MTTLTVDLTDPLLWGREDVATVVAEQRDRAPLQFGDTTENGPVWSILGYDLACAVLTDPGTFNSAGGSLLLGGSGPAGAGKMMALSDGARHRELRTPVLPYFSPRGARDQAGRIEEVATAVVADAVDRGEVDLVDVLAVVPLVIMCDLFGIPAEDRDLVVSMCDEAFLATTPQARRAGHQKIVPYLFEQAVRRRMAPASDLISTMATHRINGKLLPIEDVVANLDNIVVGGVQTVRHTAAMSICTLLRHPGAWQRLARREADLGAAIDELLRYTSVGLHVLRTATRRTELAGQVIEAGAKVAVWIWSANHDPAAFDDPDELRLDRTPNRHLALGVGPHYCVGAPLAKAQLATIHRVLFERVAAVEPAGDPVYNRSIINFGFDHLPVRLLTR